MERSLASGPYVQFISFVETAILMVHGACGGVDVGVLQLHVACCIFFF
jgi:hypothetical protein